MCRSFMGFVECVLQGRPGQNGLLAQQVRIHSPLVVWPCMDHDVVVIRVQQTDVTCHRTLFLRGL